MIIWADTRSLEQEKWMKQRISAECGYHITGHHMVRSVLEGVGYNLKLILEILEQSQKLDDIIIIGGGAKGDIWLQILADIWQKTLLVPRYLEEATSMGAATIT